MILIIERSPDHEQHQDRKALHRRLCLPYGSFGHVFKRAMLCASRTCGKVVHTDTFWLVFCQGADELAEAKTIDEKHADRALALLRERVPSLAVGK